MTRALSAYIRPEIENTPFCPGCGHGTLMGTILRAIDDLGLDMDDMLFVSGIGCAGWISSPHFNADTLHTLHGRAIAFATGAKLANPALKVMVIGGDGDLTSIGGNHLIHAARRDIDLTAVCANNMIYGMTGGQAASTTPLGCFSSTTPTGNPYRPFDLCKLLDGAGARYVARFAITQPVELRESIKKALKIKGFTFVEAISPCPTQFGRRNQLDQASDMIRYLQQHCIPKETATGNEEPDMIITGEFVGA